MAPAAAVDSSPLQDWSDEMESNGDFELASSSGNGSGAPGAPDHGWHKVTNPKKQRLRERKLKAEGGGGGEGGAGLGQDGKNSSKAFEALEKEAEARTERRKSRKAAWSASVAAAAIPAANGVHHPHGSDDEEQGSDVESKNAAVGGSANGGEKKKKAKKPKVSIADAAAAIDPVDLADYLATLSASYDDIQLIRCVDYFVKIFSPVNTVEIAWDKMSRDPLLKSVQVPIGDLPDKVCRATANWLGQKSVDSLSQFVSWALNDVLFEAQPQQKGGKSGPTVSNSTKIAVLVVVAILLRRRSEVLLGMMETLRQPKFQAPPKLYVLAWMYGQVAREDLLAGLYLWSHNLLPLAVGSSSTPVTRDIALQFFEGFVMKDLAKNRPSLLTGATRKERLISPHALIACLHMAYPPESSRTKATQRYLAIYPTVKEISLGGSTRTRALKTVAQQLLPMSLTVAEEDDPELSLEGCDLFRWCLFQSPDSYKQWEKLYPERLKGSVRVLKFLRGTWRESQSMLSPLKELQSTVTSLKLQSLKMKQDPKLEAESIKALDHCKFLQKKMSLWNACLSASVALACTAAAGYAFYLLSPDKNPWNWDGKILLSNL
ncbi:uncharacterized protein LOC112350486 [Selaginella moellendorffii]|uniref:uncharacterized protein LOC112350486 n=1 Tax=Selaginella moellendorffii TaxID=88036 RepID=UPI000D1C6222|nr:uncharacterized protein LOC112350486 [Selaginella moellendorffii]|eukprot:XP_024542580.1 uncharacterized protein LOC112350486 [Selaginella moellendorffii]